MIYSNFEQIPVWKESREFVGKLYRLTEQRFGKDFELRNQIRRAALSITLNIAEGFERKTNREFSRFITIAKGSAGECRAALYIAYDLGYLSAETLSVYLKRVIAISEQLSKFSEYLVKTSTTH